MSVGLIGFKVGMTKIFEDDGASIPVTVISIFKSQITQIKKVVTDGYSAIQVSYSPKTNKLLKPEIGHFNKANVSGYKNSFEFRLNEEEVENYKIGYSVELDVFNPGQQIDVTGISKGKGFAGVIKRHNFRMQDATHGNSLSHRAPGSIGQNQSPGRVFKGKKMSGHLGNTQCTIQNLTICKIDKDRDLILIKGAVPGSKSSIVVVRPAIKYNVVG